MIVASTEEPYWRRLFVRLVHVSIRGPYVDTTLEISNLNWIDEATHAEGAAQMLTRYTELEPEARVSVEMVTKPMRFTH